MFHRGQNLSQEQAYIAARTLTGVRCPHTSTRSAAPVPAGAVEFLQGTLDSSGEIDEARVFDTTLRDGEQSPRISFSYDDKREFEAVRDVQIGDSMHSTREEVVERGERSPSSGGQRLMATDRFASGDQRRVTYSADRETQKRYIVARLNGVYDATVRRIRVRSAFERCDRHGRRGRDYCRGLDPYLTLSPRSGSESFSHQPAFAGPQSHTRRMPRTAHRRTAYRTA